jgi:hypothetical protein
MQPKPEVQVIADIPEQQLVPDLTAIPLHVMWLFWSLRSEDTKIGQN